MDRLKFHWSVDFYATSFITATQRVTTAYDQAGTVAQLQKDWKVIHVNNSGRRLSTLSTVAGKLK
jgi:hypothetical protein